MDMDMDMDLDVDVDMGMDMRKWDRKQPCVAKAHWLLRTLRGAEAEAEDR